jgi:putative DNA primase/helicase
MPKEKSAGGLPPTDAGGERSRDRKLSGPTPRRKSATSLEIALNFITARGWSPIDTEYRTKIPVLKAWQNVRLTAETAHERFNGHRQNVSVILGEASGWLADVDHDHPLAAQIAHRILPPTASRFGRPSKPDSHHLYKVPGLKYYKKYVGEDGDGTLVELRCTPGHQTVFPGSTHESGESITWEEDGTPATVEAESLKRSVAKLAAAVLLLLHFPAVGCRHDMALALAGALLAAGWSEEEAEAFLEIVFEFGGSTKVRPKVLTVADTRRKMDAGEPIKGLPQLREILGKSVVNKVAAWLGLKSSSVVRLKPDDAAMTDVGNARALVTAHGSDLCFVPGIGWTVWDGKRNKIDETGAIYRKAKGTVGALLTEAASTGNQQLGKHALRSHSIQRLKAMVEVASTELEVIATVDELDADPMLFNCANGTIDLRSGDLRPPEQSDRITKLADVRYDADAKCPRFDQFLNEVMDGDQELIAYLGRAVGYSLSGTVGEECFFLCHGSGQNGKSKFLSTLEAVLGDYGDATDFRTLLHRDSSEAIRNDLAALRGLRLVTSVEVARGKRLDEALVKQLTGGDRISARFLRKEYFTFTPEFKLWLAANHRPEIRGTDNGIWRRVKLIPFEVTIPPEKRDRNLLQKLRGEAPGILAWAVRGCLVWQREGLNDPARVRLATASYRHESDALADFLDSCCITAAESPEPASRVKVPAAVLYKEYVRWALEDAGVDAWKATTLGIAMGERGFRSAVEWYGGRSQRVYNGLMLRDRQKMEVPGNDDDM